MLRLRTAPGACLSPERSLGGAIGLRSGLLRAIWDHDAVHHPAVPLRTNGRAAIAGQRGGRVQPVERTGSTSDGSESELRPGARCVQRGPLQRLRILATVELHLAADN